VLTRDKGGAYRRLTAGEIRAKADSFESVELKRDYPAEIPLLTGDWMVMSDSHVPLHDSRAMRAIVKAGKQLRLTNLLIAGDLMDFEEISAFRQASPNAVSPAETILAALRVLDGFSQQFSRIIVLKGNHDDRLQRLMESAVAGRNKFQFLLASLEKEELEALDYNHRYVTVLERWVADKAPRLTKLVKWSPLPQAFIAGPAGMKPWRVTHPKSYSRLAPQTERRLWQVYTQPVIGTHGHLFGMSISPNGEHPVVQIGHTSRREAVRYLAEQITDHPVWTQAFCAILKGRMKVWVNNPYLHDWWELTHG
jgi:predicted phosphodiesterase